MALLSIVGSVVRKSPEIAILPLCPTKVLNLPGLVRAKSAVASLGACWAQQSAMHSDFRAKPFP